MPTNWIIEDEADEYLATQPYAAEDLVEYVPLPRPVLRITEESLKRRVREQVLRDFYWVVSRYPNASRCRVERIEYYDRRRGYAIGKIEVRYSHRPRSAVYLFAADGTLYFHSGGE